MIANIKRKERLQMMTILEGILNKEKLQRPEVTLRMI